MLALVLSPLPPNELANLGRVSRAFHRGPPPQQPPPPAVELALRLRAEERGEALPAHLPPGERSWLQHLLAREELGDGSGAVDGGAFFSCFVSPEGELLTCGDDQLMN